MKPTAHPSISFDTFDLLATMIAVALPTGECLFANASFEQVMGL